MGAERLLAYSGDASFLHRISRISRPSRLSRPPRPSRLSRKTRIPIPHRSFPPQQNTKSIPQVNCGMLFYIYVLKRASVRLSHYVLLAIYDINAGACNLFNALTSDGKDAVAEFAFGLYIADACSVVVEFEEYA